MKNIIKYIIEFTIVAFGVFLGIYLNNRENKELNNSNKEKAIQNIITELESNSEKLEVAIQYHEQIKINLDSLLKSIPKDEFNKPYLENTKFKFFYIKDWVGNGFSEFDDTAFEVSKMSGTLQDMEIDLIQEISKIYKKIGSQSNYQDLLITRMLGINSSSTTYDAISNVILITGDNLGMEKGLMKELKESIQSIKDLSNHTK